VSRSPAVSLGLAAGQKWQSDAYPGLRARPGWTAAEAALKEAGLIYSSSGPDEVHVSDDVLFSLRYRDDHIARELGEPEPLYQAAPYPARAVVIAGAVALSRSSLIAGQNAPPAGQHQAAPGSAASSAPATRSPADLADPPVPGSCPTRRPPALSPDVAARAGRTRPGPAPAAARTGPPGPAWDTTTLIPNRLRPDRQAR